MTFSTKIKAFILVMASVAVMVIGYFGYGYIKGLATKAADEVSLWQEDQGRKEELAMLEKKIAAARTNDSALQAMFLTNDTTVRFFDTLETMGDELGATTSISSLQKFAAGTIGTTTIERVSMTIVASGDWRAIYNYLALLETLPYAARLDNVALAAEVKGVDTGNKWRTSTKWIADISLSVLKYK